MLPTFSPLHLSDRTVDKVMQRECPKGIVHCLGCTDKKPEGQRNQKGKAWSGTKDWSPLWGPGGSAAGPALKGSVGLRLCSCAMWAAYSGHGFALVILCGWVVTWVLVSKSLFFVMMWREACKLKTATMWKFEYESCQNHLAVGEKDIPFCPDHSLAVSHVCLNSQGDCKGGVQKGSGTGGKSWFFCSSPFSVSFCNEGAQSNRHTSAL